MSRRYVNIQPRHSNAEASSYAENSDSQPPGRKLKKRQVITVACDRCRRRKIRCDGIRPSCSSCSGISSQCSYRDHPNLSRETRRLIVEVVDILAHLPDGGAVEVLRRLRGESDAAAILARLREKITPETGAALGSARAHLPFTARPPTKGAAPITPDPDSSPPEELLLFNQKDDNIQGLPSIKPRKSHSKTRAQAQKQRPKTRGIPEVNKKQSSSDKLDLSLEVQPTEKRKSSRRKSKRNTESILTPPEHHNQLEDPKNSDNDRAVILSDIDEEDLPRNPQRRKTLERNRVAARKCRVQKRDKETVLASREQAVEDQNRYLSNTYNSLAAELYFLKNELLRHTNCNCTLIQEYIANEAKRTVEKMSRSPFNPQASHSHRTPSAMSDENIHHRRDPLLEKTGLAVKQ